jgi:putative PEP-CTERM system histidine kinase
MSSDVLVHLLDGLPFLAAAAASALAGYLLLTPKSKVPALRLAAWAVLAGLVQAANGLAVWMPEHAVFWRRLTLIGELFQPGCLLWVLLPLLPDRMQPVPYSSRGAQFRVGAVIAIGMAAGLFAWTWSGLLHAPAQGIYGLIFINSPGRALYSFILVGLVLGLAQIEQLLRTLPEHARYQLKFILLGLGILAAYDVYEVSQVLLLGGFRIEGVWVWAVALMMAAGMIWLGLRRVGPDLMAGSLYISPQVAYGSLTFLLIGLYLLAAGLVGEWVRYTGTSFTEGLRILVFLVAAVGLAVLLASRTVRARTKQFVARNFYRSPYDYRAKWLEVTDAFQATHSQDAILDQTLTLLSRTFGAPRLSIWTRREADGRFFPTRSVNPGMPALSLDPEHQLVSELQEAEQPVEIGSLRFDPETAAVLQTSNAVLGVPIRPGERLLAFILLSADPRKASYGVDDRDLLRAIAHHVGVLLSHAQLAEERRAAAQVEAVNHLAAFCVHDLKNLAARLSLVVQNAKRHGQDPGFQASAMRTVSTTVDKMLALIAKFSPQSREGVVNGERDQEAVDVHAVISECVAELPDSPGIRVRVNDGNPPPVRFVREQLGQVLTNLILNARQAIGDEGEIAIQTSRQDRNIVITITDTGPGIPADRLPSVFRPFQTSKANGLGLGLYQCRRIVEAHGGSLFLESEIGKGTAVRVVLPVAATPTPVEIA